jgi:hypothetical protein
MILAGIEELFERQATQFYPAAFAPMYVGCEAKKPL